MFGQPQDLYFKDVKKARRNKTVFYLSTIFVTLIALSSFWFFYNKNLKQKEFATVDILQLDTKPKDVLELVVRSDEKSNVKRLKTLVMGTSNDLKGSGDLPNTFHTAQLYNFSKPKVLLKSDVKSYTKNLNKHTSSRELGQDFFIDQKKAKIISLNGKKQKAGEVSFFKETFEVPKNATDIKATLYTASKGLSTFWINGGVDSVKNLGRVNSLNQNSVDLGINDFCSNTSGNLKPNITDKSTLGLNGGVNTYSVTKYIKTGTNVLSASLTSFSPDNITNICGDFENYLQYYLYISYKVEDSTNNYPTASVELENNNICLNKDNKITLKGNAFSDNPSQTTLQLYASPVKPLDPNGDWLEIAVLDNFKEKSINFNPSEFADF